ncbi:MAG: site-2 protease family protein, partial [Candidatus Helarchaeota archaeon]
MSNGMSDTSPIKENSRIIDKIRMIIEKYHDIELFREEVFSVEPTCIIKIDSFKSIDRFKEILNDFREIGYQIKYHPLSDEELEELGLVKEDNIKKYRILFEARHFKTDKDNDKKKKSNLVIQLILLGVTIGMVILSGWFYLTFIDPYFGGLANSPHSFVVSMVTFCIGMLSIIIFHEFGHYLIARYHELDASLPYLIPGPPPIGMLGAFVSIKDDPRTRNEKFDVAIGGIVLGVIVSLVLVIIGLLLSEQMDMNSFLQFRVACYGKTLEEQAKLVHGNLNSFNLLFLGVRYFLYEPTTFSTHYGYYLPDKILLIHPLAFTGWIGLLISGLNLLPISFFDGGHALKAIYPSKYTKLIGVALSALACLFLNLYLFFFVWIGFIGAIQDLTPDNKSSEIPNPT